MTTSIPLHICLRVLQRLQIFGNNLWEQLKTTILNFQKSPVKSGFVAVGTSSNFTTFRVSPVMTTSIPVRIYKLKKVYFKYLVVTLTGSPVMSCCGARPYISFTPFSKARDYYSINSAGKQGFFELFFLKSVKLLLTLFSFCAIII